MNTIETMKLALEALTHLQPTALTSFYTIGDRDKAITALREALAEQKSGIKQVIELYDSPDQPAQQEPGRNYYEDGDVFERIAAMKKQPSQQEPVAGKGKELSERLKLCARNVAFVAAGRVDMSSAAMQEMFALIDHVCVGLDSPQPSQQEPVAFEEWLAKQHGDPEDIGFLQALRIAYIAGQDSITSPPAQRKPLTHEQRFDLLTKFEPHKNKWEAPAILIDMVEAAHGIKRDT